MTAYDQGPPRPELDDEAEVTDVAFEATEAESRAEALAIEAGLLDTSPPPVHVWQAIERTLRREGRIG